MTANCVHSWGDWVEDLEEGKRLAEKENKDLLINFTGSEWCYSCMKFKHEVLEKPAFAPARNLFVLVELEYPRSPDMLPEDIREKYIAWSKNYDIKVSPTVILADATGKPYAYPMYSEENPQQYLELLRDLSKVHGQRDKALAKAALAEGGEKAKYLDEALSTLQKVIPEDKTLFRGDPLVRFYRSEIDQIIALDAAGQSGLGNKYRRVLEAEAAQKKIAELYDRISEVVRMEGMDKAIKVVEQELEHTTSMELRRGLQSTKQLYLEWSNRFEEALAYTKEMLNDPALSADSRRFFRTRVAFNLVRLKRMDEALAIYDELISEAAGNRHWLKSYHEEKAEIFKMAGRLEEALQMYEAALQYADPGTVEWMDIEWFLADVMQQLGCYEEATEVYKSVLKYADLNTIDIAGILAALAFSLAKAGHNKEALEKIRQADDMLAGAIISRAERESVKVIKSRIKAAQEEIKYEDKKDNKGQ